MRRLFPFILALCPALLAIPSAYAQDVPEAAAGDGDGLDGATIADVLFEGLKRVDADAVRILMTSRAGRTTSKKAISDDIRAIYGTGYFDDVQAYAERKDNGEVLLTFSVTEKPSIRRVEISGNDDVSTEDIKNVVDLRPFTIFNEAKVKKNVQKVKDLYLSKGFYLAEVSSKLERLASGEVVVTIQIAENAKVQVRQIRLIGNHHIETDYLKDGLATREGNLLSFLSDSGTYRAEAFQIDLLRISSAYFDRGYINVKVEPPDVEISPDRKYLYITIRIEEGEQYSVGKLDFSGDLIVEKPELFGLIKSKEGEIFNRSELGLDLQSLKTRYEDDGFAYANITPLTQIDADKRTISITFDIQKGNKVYYERINIVGNSKTRDKVIRRELRIYEGDLTSATLRELSKRRVQALGYFEKVDIKTRKGSSEELQIVDIEVKERATGTFQIGAGLSSAENFIINAQVAQENFLGRGQSVALSASISGIQQQFQLRFTEPYLFDSDWTFSFDAFNYSTSFRNFVRQSFGGDLTLGHPLLIDELKLLFTYTLEFVQSRASDGSSLQPAFAALNDRGRISSLRATLLYDSRDNRLFPTEGHYHSLSVEVSDTFLGATESRKFQKYSLLNRYYHPVFWKVVGKLSARWGVINSGAPAGLAPSEKFILGGINSIRGYLPYSVGPERRAAQNDRGVQLYNPYSSTYFFVEGGNKQFLFNAELEFPIFEEVGIKGVVFVDAGNTFAEDESFFYLGDKARSERSDAFDLRTLPMGLFWSVGFGFRWFSPIGPLRFEWGIPLTRRPGDDPGPVFEFSIGNAF